ncbi:hypothetical protein KCMC57_up43590 [Kitasatospora sp. CMC57]
MGDNLPSLPDARGPWPVTPVRPTPGARAARRPSAISRANLANTAITFYLGANLFTVLDADRSRTDSLFAMVKWLAPRARLLTMRLPGRRRPPWPHPPSWRPDRPTADGRSGVRFRPWTTTCGPGTWRRRWCVRRSAATPWPWTIC